MKKNILKSIALILGTVMIGLCSFSCSSKNPQAYLLEGAEDNGFVAAYRAYFYVDGDEAGKISKHRFEKWIYDDDIDTLEIDTLKEYLEEMGVSYKGNIYIQILEFDEYIALEVECTSDNSSESASRLFRNGKMLEIPTDVTFRSVDDVYKFRG